MANRLAYYEGAVFKAIQFALHEGEDLPQGTIAPPPEAPPVSLEQLQAAYPAQPQIGQDVGLFEIAKMT